MSSTAAITHRSLTDILLVLAAGTLVSLLYLQTTTRWWYEDDPAAYAAVAAIANPASIFFDVDTIRSFGENPGVVPMVMLSFWLDIRLFGFDPLPAYIHSYLAFAATLALLHLLLLRATEDRSVSVAATLLWAVLPTTLVVHQFISTRGYMEGLLFCLAALLLTHRLVGDGGKSRPGLWLALGVSSAVSMLYKEAYVVLLPSALFLAGFATRRAALCALAVVLAIAYAAYRFWISGINLVYAMPLLGIADYLDFLAVFPITFSANPGGYLVYAILGGLTVLLLFRERGAGFLRVVCFGAIVVTGLLAIYPVSLAILRHYDSPGPWYRVPFVMNTVLCVWGAYLVARLLPSKAQLGVLLVAALVVLPGAERTRRLWQERMTRAELEGRFYLTHPDKLLYSQEAAYWFIRGVHDMYDVPRKHYIDRTQHVSEHAREMLRSYPTIWRVWQRSDGLVVVQDDGLHQELRRANAGVKE